MPAGFQDDGLPFGVTLFAPAFQDGALARYAGRFQEASRLPLGATGRPWPSEPRSSRASGCEEGRVKVVVCGAHLSALPLNYQLTDRGGRLMATTRTAPRYRLYALPGGPPARPGLIRDNVLGRTIEAEVWDLSIADFGSFVAEVPAPLVIGSVELADGSWEKGFLCESRGVAGAKEITALGGWKAYLATRAGSNP